jgi:septal ring factor EnvC (AmiA/AmiB activator)
VGHGAVPTMSDTSDPLADAEELLDLLIEHRRVRIAALVQIDPRSRESDLAAVLQLQATIETMQRVVVHEQVLSPTLAGKIAAMKRA